MKSFALLSILLSLGGVSGTPTDDLLKAFNNWSDAFKQYHKNPKLLDEFITEDAVACLEGECSPFHDVYAPFFEKKHKVFDYMTDIRAVTETQVLIRCYDYMEYEDGCSTMLYVDAVFTINKDGKITKTESFINEEQYAKFAKCQDDDTTTTADEEKATTADDDLVKVFNDFSDAFKQYHKNPKLIDEFITEDAVSCMEGECSSFHDVYAPFFEKKPKVFDYMVDVHSVTKTQVLMRCYDYMEYDDGCSTMFYVDGAYTIKDGKIVKADAFINEEQHAAFGKCQQDDAITDEEKPTIVRTK